MGQKGSIQVSTGSGLATAHTLTAAGAVMKGQTPSVNWVVGPTQYYVPGYVLYYGVEPGTWVQVTVKTDNGSQTSFNLDVGLRN
jgi:hypothetical protein